MLCLQGTATKILELVLDKTDFPSAAVALAAQLACVLRAAAHMEAFSSDINIIGYSR